jgi:hypothetical protein
MERNGVDVTVDVQVSASEGERTGSSLIYVLRFCDRAREKLKEAVAEWVESLPDM